MKKHFYLLSILALVFINVGAQTQPKYTDWLFIQSDKALQYRMAVVKQVGDVASLQFQFRVNNEDEVFCKSSMCDGMLLVLSNTNVGDSKSTNYSFVFEKSFVGVNNIYTWPTLLTTELKTWPDGSKRFLSQKRGVVYTVANSTIEQTAYVPSCCVDVILAGRPNEHRCTSRDFSFEKAIHVK